ISGDDTVIIGRGIESTIVDIQRVDFTDPSSGRKVTIFDTPGFDESVDGFEAGDFSDTDILKKIVEFLFKEYDAHRKLDGLVYFQKISEPRFSTRQSKRTLTMFKKLCGADTFKNTVVLTTFWDNVSEEKGEARERDMHIRFQELIEGDALFMRYTREFPDTPQKVIDYILTLMP
ncbi:hypothetical protein BDP27DRAFT_1335225, partial [Rhodocollybia butyracea]